MMPTSQPVHDTAISVVVAHKDPLVREGVASILRTAHGIELGVAMVNSGSGWGVREVDRCRFTADVVVADYETALTLFDAEPMSPLRSMRPPRIMVVSHRDKESEIRYALDRGVLGYVLIDCALEEMIDGIRALHRGHRHLNRSAAMRVVEGFNQEALTPREVDVLDLIASGLMNKVIAIELRITVGTVKSHVKAILSKLGAKTRTEAAAIALRRGLRRHHS